jgi:hypothetical protein
LDGPELPRDAARIAAAHMMMIAPATAQLNSLQSGFAPPEVKLERFERCLASNVIASAR